MFRIKELDLELMHYALSLMLDCTYIMNNINAKNSTKVIDKVKMLNNRLAKINDIIKKMNEIITTNEEER